jgi:hypothetical protein
LAKQPVKEKKMKKLNLIAIIVMTLICALSFAACDLDNNNTDNKENVNLAVPTGLAINGNSASWNAVTNAKSTGGYTIKIGSTETVVNGTTHSLTSLNVGTYQISVKTNGYETSTHSYKSSAYSTAVSYTVSGGDPYNPPPYPMAPIGGVTAGLTFTYYAAGAAGTGTPACYYVDKGTATATEINIPHMYNGTNGNLLVLGIANNGFANANITSVFISDGMNNIGANAFQNCTGLTSVTIPNTVKSIANGAFSGCTNLSITWYYPNPYPNGFTFDTNQPPQHAAMVKKVIFPTSIMTITMRSLENFSNLTSIIIPTTVTSIEMLAFTGCTSLTSIYYTGNATQWNAITKGNNALPTNATVYYYSATQPAANPGNYWHYVGNDATLWQ